jgi:hypothetical protein
MWNDVRQTETRVAAPLVPELRTVVVKMTTENLKRPKSPGI